MGTVLKKYNEKGKSFFDFIVKKGDDLYTKYKTTNLDYLANKIKNADDVSISGNIGNYELPTHGNISNSYTNSLPLQKVVVNSKIPHVYIIDSKSQYFKKGKKKPLRYKTTGVRSKN